MTTKKQVTIHTDGSCIGNPGPGGYGAVLKYGEHRRELSRGYRLTTNNRMELMGPIESIASLKQRCSVILYSDSKYVVDSISQGWAKRWQANSWKRNKKDRAINPDLWARLLELCSEHDVEFRWVRGHSGNFENERCDQLAVEAANQKNLFVDENYESLQTVQRGLV